MDLEVQHLNRPFEGGIKLSGQSFIEGESKGFGLTIQDRYKLAYSIIAQSGRKNPFNAEEKKRHGMTGCRDSETGIHAYLSVHFKVQVLLVVLC